MTNDSAIAERAEAIRTNWESDPRWAEVQRDHTPEDVVRLQGSFVEQQTIASTMANKLWTNLNEHDYVNALGAMTGGQAVQMVRAGLEAIYLSGWQVAADANLSESVYPDQSLYPANSAPSLVRRINNALMRADEIEWSEGDGTRDWMVPIIADAESGFGGPLNVFELTKSFVQAGAAAVHLEDQLSSEKKCGHMGGKVLVPTSHHVRTLKAARLAADVMDVPTIIIARTDSLGASLLTADIDERDRQFTTGERTAEGFYTINNGMESAISRGLA
ncbi:MAG: isocitrate lyase, partial [Acidimicrobiia bacterium]